MNLTPVQYLLWIICLEVASLPVASILVAAIFNAYYMAKEAHAARQAKASGEALKELGEIFKSKKGEGDK